MQLHRSKATAQSITRGRQDIADVRQIILFQGHDCGVCGSITQAACANKEHNLDDSPV